MDKRAYVGGYNQVVDRLHKERQDVTTVMLESLSYVAHLKLLNSEQVDRSQGVLDAIRAYERDGKIPQLMRC